MARNGMNVQKAAAIGKRHGKKTSRRRQSDVLGNVLLGNIGSWDHVEVTYLNIITDQVHTVKETFHPV